MIIIAEKNDATKGSKKQDEVLLNTQIRFPMVRLIGPDGQQLGTMSSRDAQLKANEYDLDLMCVASNANPPVCKLVNYGKFRYEQQKKARLARKNQKIVELKEIQLTPQIGLNDMQTKAKNANKFLSEGNKVKVCVRFRGRQLSHTEVGMETIMRFIEMVADLSSIEKQPTLEGRWLIAILTPKKQKNKEEKQDAKNEI